MTNKIQLSTETEEFFRKLEDKDNFSYITMGRDEQEKIIAEDIDAKALLESLSVNDERFYYGIPSPDSDREMYYWYVSRLRGRKISFANIFSNAVNRESLKELKRDTVIITEAEEIPDYPNDNVISFYSLNKYHGCSGEEKTEKIIDEIKKDHGSEKNLLYLVSADVLSAPIITGLFRVDPNNTYIEISSKDGIATQIEDQWMYDPKNTSFDVSVVLTTYKKPQALAEQLKAIESQSLKPKEILLYQDGIDEEYNIRFKDTFLKRFDNTKICDKNTGVWERFDFARTAKSEYVCIFDDDTIPGHRWLENCHSNMIEREGVYGTIGIVMENGTDYPFKGYYRVGWAEPYSKRIQVDFVGHSWFVRKEYLDYMFDDTEEFQKFKRAGEDMGLSFKCQQHGIPTFVPPHPYNDQSLWGSQIKSGYKYGNADTAISRNSSGNDNMRKVLSMYVKKGWEFYCEKNGETVRKNKRNIEIERIIDKIGRGKRKLRRLFNKH